jgi:N-acetylmuramoyl-L-alanine amidase
LKTGILNSADIRYLVVHCSDTPNDEALEALDIHQMHLGFGWNGIGYHRVITRDGRTQQGRPDYWVGAHVYDHNGESLGVCLIGQDDFTPEQMDALEAVLRIWKAEHSHAEIRGHCDFSTTEKTCPNFDAANWAATRGIG